jgi:nitric-oxide synthase
VDSLCPNKPVRRENVFQRWDLAVAAPGSPGAAPVDSLQMAARGAWRNALRCIGRLHWRSLNVVDARTVSDVDSLFDTLCEHLRAANNGGQIRPVMTVFAPWSGPDTEIRVWNHQLIRYAGYPASDGTVKLGDPANADITRLATALGWRPPARPGRFDVLPLVLQCGSRLVLRELPRELVLEVPLRHPSLPWFERLGLRWHAVPAIADMIFATGADCHPCAPFNGWYMGTEIGARNLADANRYNQLPIVAEKMGLDTRNSRNLWRDHALLAINEAVLHSFERDGVRLVDHHQASVEFVRFCDHEEREGREVSADWTWIVPPMSGSATPVFHRSYPEKPELPNFLPQQQAWISERGRRLLGGYDS